MSKGFDIRSWGESRLDRCKPSTGDEMTAVCPACGKFGSFYFNTRSGKYVCFKCDFRGNSVFGLVATAEGISWEEAVRLVFRQAVQFRRRDDLETLKSRIASLRISEDDDELPDGDVMAELPSEMKPIYRKGKWRLPKYLKSRRIKSYTARAWNMGYCTRGRYRNRLIIPIVCPNGQSFTSRDMTGELEPKYLNPKGIDHKRLLIGWDIAKLGATDFCVVEGPIDAVIFNQHGIPTIGLGGKVLHDEQFDLLCRLDELCGVTVVLDPEEKTAPFKVAERLSSHFRNVYIGRLPDGIDPGKSNLDQAMETIEKAKKFTGDRKEYVSALRDRINALGEIYIKI